MLILAIDTALENCAAALLDTDSATILASEAQAMSRGHAEALMPMIARVMDAGKTDYFALDRIAVTTGPGSFTGLRVGISAARGIGLAANKPVVGVTTLSAYSAVIVATNSDAPIVAAIDARHDNVYFQAVSGNGAMLIRPRAASIDEALRTTRFGAAHLVGNAAQILADRWPDDMPLPLSVTPDKAPDINWVAWLGAAATVGKAPAKPFYLKAPDAKIPESAALPHQ
jgi:tRNA threonylcarbamoyladenosine biosynthesis protein TsaB